MLAKLSKTKLVNWELWLAESQPKKSQSTAFGVHTHSSDYVTAHVQNLHWEIITGCGQRIRVSIYSGEDWKRLSRLCREGCHGLTAWPGECPCATVGFRMGSGHQTGLGRLSQLHPCPEHTGSIFISFKCYSSW